MALCGALSDYDKETLKMLKGAKLLIIDLDGTLIDFEKIDNVIIAELFSDSRIINTIDNILWKINKLDIFGNGYAGLKLRLAVYSLFSKYSHKECKEKYEKMYQKLARIDLISIYSTLLSDIVEAGYDIAIVTKNVYARNVLNRTASEFKRALEDHNAKLIIFREHKEKKFKELIREYDGKVCVIGNNLSDDILNSFKVGSPYIYIGKSKAVKGIISFTNRFFKKRGIQFRSIRQIRNVFTS